jgi:DNA-binding NarL/FixJ family response regulator
LDAIRVLIADDHPVFRDGMHGLLDSVSDTEVAGEAATGDEVISQAVALQPDVILMDIQMPGVNGIEATRQIVHTSPHIGVLVVTMYEDDDFVFSAMRAGARGYLLKGANQAEILRAIRAVANGEVIFGPGIAQRVISFLAAPHPAAPQRMFPELTERESEVLSLIAGSHQRRDRQAPGAQPEDRPQPRLEHLQ